MIFTDRFQILKPRRFIRPFFAEALAFRSLRGEKQIFFFDFMFFKLLRQRLIRTGGFTKNEHAGGFFVEPVENRNFVAALAEPFMQTVRRKRIRLVNINAGRFMDDEQVGVFVENQPGGHCNARPPSKWTCRCGTLSPASRPLLMTSR